jgi:hypothetical protein
MFEGESLALDRLPLTTVPRSRSSRFIRCSAGCVSCVPQLRFLQPQNRFESDPSIQKTAK